MADCKPKMVPIPSGTKVVKAGRPLDTATHPYAEAVGALMYLAVCTRPDIFQAVSLMARYVFQYVKGTAGLALTCGSEGEFAVYINSDFAGDRDTRRSTAGLVVMNRGAAIDWSSKLMPTVALSTRLSTRPPPTLSKKPYGS